MICCLEMLTFSGESTSISFFAREVSNLHSRSLNGAFDIPNQLSYNLELPTLAFAPNM